MEPIFLLAAAPSLAVLGFGFLIGLKHATEADHLAAVSTIVSERKSIWSSALVLMLSAISLGRIGYGLILTVVFSFGLAATLTGIGLIFLYIGSAFGRTSFAESRIVKTLPVFSAFVVTIIGGAICYNSLG